MILRLIPLPTIRSRDRARFGPLAQPEFAELWQTSLGPTRGEMYKNADNFVPSGLDQPTRHGANTTSVPGFLRPHPGSHAAGLSSRAGRTLLNGRWLPPHMPWV